MQLDGRAAPDHRMVGFNLADVDHLVGIDIQLAQQVIAMIGFQIVHQPAQRAAFHVHALRDYPQRLALEQHGRSRKQVMV